MRSSLDRIWRRTWLFGFLLLVKLAVRFVHHHGPYSVGNSVLRLDVLGIPTTLHRRVFSHGSNFRGDTTNQNFFFQESILSRSHTSFRCWLELLDKISSGLGLTEGIDRSNVRVKSHALNINCKMRLLEYLFEKLPTSKFHRKHQETLLKAFHDFCFSAS